MRFFVISFLYFIPFVSNGQVFQLDTIQPNGGLFVSEMQLHGQKQYYGGKYGLLLRSDDTTFYSHSIIDPNSCLHIESKCKDIEVLSNGSLAGIFYRDESCITPESAFAMLDSNGNVLVDKRFAKGYPLFNGGIIEHKDTVHLYVIHVLPSNNYRGFTHYKFDLNGFQLDSISRFDSNLAWASYTGFDGFKTVNDSLLVQVGQYSPTNPYEYQLVAADFDLNPNYRIIYSDTLNAIQRWKKFENKIALVLYRGSYLGYRSGFGTISMDGTNTKIDTSILGSSIEYGDLLPMRNYYVVTEYNHNPGHTYQNLIIYDTNLNIINRQLVPHNVNQSNFIKTSDSTFLLYDETWIHEYTMNFDSIAGYVSSVNTLFTNHNPELEVQVFPNPTSSSILIKYQESKEVVVNIFAISGITLAKKKEYNTSETVINLSTYPKGLYVLQVKTERGMRTVKVVRE